MNLIDTIKGIDFERLREMNKQTEKQWSDMTMNQAKETVMYYHGMLDELLQCAVNEGYIKQSDLEGLKKFDVISTYKFYYTVEAESVENAEGKLQVAIDFGEYKNPMLKLIVDGVNIEADGDWVDDRITELRY